jgi:tetratricopeptide (TPR) repeat protein
MGISRMADAVTSTASAFSTERDPEFVRLAAPSTLKMIEMLLEKDPAHPGLLMTACSGFTQYAYAFLDIDAEMTEPRSPADARDLRARASMMYERARGYCLRALELRHRGIGDRMTREPRQALEPTTRADVPALYWTALASGALLALADNQLAAIGDLAFVRAALERALQLDETWEHGAIHEALIAVEGLPALLGGSPARARRHFDRAVELSKGESAFAYVTMASVAQRGKDRAEFERLLRAALAIDPCRRPAIRLANLIAQKRARFLLSRADRLF